MRNKICVFAQLMGENDFILTEHSTLGNIEIDNWLDIPRETDDEGNPRKDLFAFCLKDNNDKDKLKPGEIVDLISE